MMFERHSVQSDTTNEASVSRQGSFIDISNPPEEIKESLCQLPHKECYKHLATLYGGKAAGLILSSWLMRQMPSELSTRIREPFQIVVSEDDLISDVGLETLRGFPDHYDVHLLSEARSKESLSASVNRETLKEIYNTFTARGVERIVIRSSGEEEDGFFNNHAGLGESHTVELSEGFEKFCLDFSTKYLVTKRSLDHWLGGGVHLVIAEHLELDAVSVVYSSTNLHANKTRISTYHRESDMTLTCLEPEDEEALRDLCEVITLVDRENQEVQHYPALPNPFTTFEQADIYDDTLGDKLSFERDLLGWYSLRTTMDILEYGCIQTETICKLSSFPSFRRPTCLGRYTHRWGAVEYTEEKRESTKMQTEVVQDYVGSFPADYLHKIGVFFEDTLGWAVDLEIGFDNQGDIFFLQNRPVINKTAEPLVSLPSKIEYPIAFAQVAQGQFERTTYLHTWSRERKTDEIFSEEPARVVTPQSIALKRFGQAADAGESAGKLFSSMLLGDVFEGITVSIDGHGGTGIDVGNSSEIHMSTSLLYPLLNTLGEKFGEHDFRLPYKVHIVSDGNIGYISLAEEDVDRFRSDALSKLEELERRLDDNKSNDESD